MLKFPKPALIEADQIQSEQNVALLRLEMLIF